MITPDELREEMRGRAEELVSLHARVHETFQQRERSAATAMEWKRACEDFHANYDQLAFPGGERTAIARVRSGEALAMEAAVCFLELRPYFFRSGYMFKDMLRACRKAPLSAEQRTRFEAVEARYREWLKRRPGHAAPGV